MTPREVLALLREKEVKAVDLRFMDFPGLWKHVTIPAEALDEHSFEDGIGFDGSSLRGWQKINEADMLLVPQPDTLFLDPFRQDVTLAMICNIQDPSTREDYPKDPRNVARKAISYMKYSGIADAANFGPSMEFFVFDDVKFDQTTHSAFYYVDSNEAAWNTGRDERPNLGYKVPYRQGYFPCPPTDHLHDLRSEMMRVMLDCGMTVESHHHEKATAGQCAIDVRYADLVQSADAVLKYKYIVKNVAHRRGKTATFMPKPLFDEYGCGMHVHGSLWKNGNNLFAGSGASGLSELAEYAIGGILRHARALCAITNPTTNSYKRLVPGFEAPTRLAYSQRNRSAAIRIPVYSSRPRSRRIEYRLPDGSANPYLAFSAILMAMLDGIINKIHPGPPLDKDIYDLPAEELKDVPTPPTHLDEALKALEKDHDFLLKGDVFTDDVIETWVQYKRKEEVEAIRLRPHPYEFALYFDS
ncbi:type I glutamate--ammonia ligase [Fimbriiglobus ruber]|uniref:Glutamine synthetase type I n=1 Tax=Fimbriiglobus ruber TaxID=1908690 RepID=A0A225DV46_9BACT|nr:type I glutamate--ammonia ligase [Fimbriiglobus ruber]OWK43534.1 Glutamine synthetase type I [Fimbriiglobus ruber]